MRKNNLSLSRFLNLLLMLLIGLCAGKASAQIYAQDDAGAYTAWGTGTNYGFGFQPWVL